MIRSLDPQPWLAEELPTLRPVPVLMYHSLDDSESVISIAPKVFRRQMESLREWGFQGIRLCDLFDAWEGKRPLPSHPVVLTFDDGFRNLSDHAIPVFEDLCFRATIFAVAGRCGRTNDWPSQIAEIPHLPLLSWSDLRQIAAAGFEIGAHGITHAPLPALSQREAEREITGAKEILQAHLGEAVTSFAYPYGLADTSHRYAVAASYRGACGTDLGIARPSCDRHHLQRIDMHYYRTQALFRLFPTRLGPAYLGLRAFGRTCRQLLLNSRQW
jgi:peptidoglycan/xylan/chitin deacetylase (PgdA/CDA1 family)